MKKFIPVELKIVFLEEEDVIRTSLFGENDNTGDKETDNSPFSNGSQTQSLFGL